MPSKHCIAAETLERLQLQLAAATAPCHPAHRSQQRRIRPTAAHFVNLHTPTLRCFFITRNPPSSANCFWLASDCQCATCIHRGNNLTIYKYRHDVGCLPQPTTPLTLCAVTAGGHDTWRAMSIPSFPRQLSKGEEPNSSPCSVLPGILTSHFAEAHTSHTYRAGAEGTVLQVVPKWLPRPPKSPRTPQHLLMSHSHEILPKNSKQTEALQGSRLAEGPRWTRPKQCPKAWGLSRVTKPVIIAVTAQHVQPFPARTDPIRR